MKRFWRGFSSTLSVEGHRGHACAAEGGCATLWLVAFICFFSFFSSAQFAAAEIDGEAMAKEVVIHRDKWGVPHIKAKTDAGAVFGFAYSQAEDFFWQLEDSYIMSVGRYAEVNGDAGLDNDLLNRTFEIVPRAKEDFEKSPPERKAIAERSRRESIVTSNITPKRNPGCWNASSRG